jgi:hypothetical protein
VVSSATNADEASEVNVHKTVSADNSLILVEDTGIGLSSEFIPGLGLRVIGLLARHKDVY